MTNELVCIPGAELAGSAYRIRLSGHVPWPHLRLEGSAIWVPRVWHDLPMKALWFLVLTMFPLVVFAYRLEANPPGFFIDESIYGYEAYTLLTTKGFSSSGEFLPRLFHNPGETVRNHGLYAYVAVPFVALFGLNEVAVRLGAVLSSIALLWVLYFFLKGVLARSSLLLAALWWPLTSWVFLLSRFGAELMTTALLATVALWIVTSMAQSKPVSAWKLLLLDCILVALFFMYAAGPVLTLGYAALGLIVLLRKRAYRLVPVLALSLVVVGLLSAEYIWDGSMFLHVGEAQRCVRNLGCVGWSLASHFNAWSYFADSYIPYDFRVSTHSIAGTSLVPRALAVFLLLGLGDAARRLVKRQPVAVLLLCAVGLAIAPATVLRRGFDSYRSVALLPIVFVLIAIGIDLCVRQAHRWPCAWRNLLAALFVLGTAYFGRAELRAFAAYEDYERAAIDWQYGYRQILDVFKANYEQYDAFLATETVAYSPEMYIRFYDPQGRYTKVRIQSTCPADSGEMILCAARPWEQKWETFTVLATVYHPGGQKVAFFIGEPPGNSPHRQQMNPRPRSAPGERQER